MARLLPAKRRKFRIRRGDTVRVLTGKSKGVTGDVLKVLTRESRVLVSGVNMIKRHVKPSTADPGGIKSRESAIHISNVALIDPESNKPTRVRLVVDEDGRKVRHATRSGRVIER